MSVSPEDEALPLIGRKERVAFPAWDLHRVRAKVDTGAFSSALDVAGYELIEGDQGPVVRLIIALSRRRPELLRCVEEPVSWSSTVFFSQDNLFIDRRCAAVVC
jgi:hypothetical protein